MSQSLIKNGMRIEKLLMFGYPPFGQPWIYHYSNIKPPFLYQIWIFFNKLINIGFFISFKEMMIIEAEQT